MSKFKFIILYFIILLFSCQRTNMYKLTDGPKQINKKYFIENGYVFVERYSHNNIYNIEIFKENVLFEYNEFYFYGDFHSISSYDEKYINCIYIKTNLSVIQHFKNILNLTKKDKYLFYISENKKYQILLYDNLNVIQYIYEN